MRLAKLIVLIVCASLLLGCATVNTAANRSISALTPVYTQFSNLEPLPGWKSQQNAGSVFNSQQISIYLNVFADEWIKKGFSNDRSLLVAAFNSIELHWQKQIFVNYGNPQRLLGLTKPDGFGKLYVYVYDYSQERRTDLGFTALGHELIHIALLATEGDIYQSHDKSKDGNWYGKYKDLEDAVNLKFIN